MLYRSYGLLLFIIALVVAGQGFRHDLPVGACLAGLILLIDLPLRWLGNIVPWREYDVALWPISPYRGSHIFYIPTWLVGVAGLGIGIASFLSPDFRNLLERSGKDKPPLVVQQPKESPPPAPPPPAPPPAPLGELEVEVAETVLTALRHAANRRSMSP